MRQVESEIGKFTHPPSHFTFFYCFRKDHRAAVKKEKYYFSRARKKRKHLNIVKRKFYSWKFVLDSSWYCIVYVWCAFPLRTANGWLRRRRYSENGDEKFYFNLKNPKPSRTLSFFHQRTPFIMFTKCTKKYGKKYPINSSKEIWKYRHEFVKNFMLAKNNHFAPFPIWNQ